MRYSYQEFYNVFGLTPDDVGPSSAGALTQSGVGVSAFVVLFAFLPLALALLGSVAVSLFGESNRSKRKGDAERKGDRVRAVVWLAAPVVVAVAIYWLFARLTRGHNEWPQLVIVGVAALLIAYRIYRNKDLPYLSSAWVIALAAIAVGAGTLFASLPGDAKKTAQRAIAFPNEPVRFVHTHRKLFWFDHMGVIRVRTDPVEVRAMDGEKARPTWLPSGRLIYLGNAGGRDFVYAPSRHQTLQIPDGSVVLLTKSNKQHCHYWKHRL
jgi:general stress protein CsbA